MKQNLRKVNSPFGKMLICRPQNRALYSNVALGKTPIDSLLPVVPFIELSWEIPVWGKTTRPSTVQNVFKVQRKLMVTLLKMKSRKPQESAL